jgi:parallel beta-helix repeat protein
MNRLFKLISVAGILISCSLSSFAREYYVSGTGTDSLGSLTEAQKGTESTPYRNLGAVASRVSPGDIVWVKNGIYSGATWSRSGTAAAPIVIKAFPNHTPEVKISAGRWFLMQINASYLTFEGLILTGNAGNVTLAQAQQDAAASTASSVANVNDAGFNTVDSRAGEGTYAHHITLRNNIIRRFGCGGINLTGDYMVVENNKIYENGWYTRYGCSGMSYFTTRNFDGNTGYRNRITGNIMWNNKGLIPYYKDNKLTDGNGMIMDVDQTNKLIGRFKATSSGTTLTVTEIVSGSIKIAGEFGSFLKGTGMPTVTNNSSSNASIVSQTSGTPGGVGVYVTNIATTANGDTIESWAEDDGYTGSTLIANNLAVNNGGSGMHIFHSQNFDVVNNTVYQNGAVLDKYADLYGGYSKNVKFRNNVVYARTGRLINRATANTNVTYDYNIYFDGATAAGLVASTKGSKDQIADPEFVNPSLTPCVEDTGGLTLTCTADFSLKSTSPAINKGTYIANVIPLTDIRGIARTTSNIDLGAYESGVAPVITSSKQAVGLVGYPLSYTIKGSGTINSFTATGLPAELTLNSSTGVISGSPASASTFTVQVSAINNFGTGSDTVTFTIKTLPTGWAMSKVGSGTTDTVASDGTTWTLGARANRMAGNSDNFSSIWQSNAVTGSVMAKARVIGNTDTSTYSAGCVVIRETEDVDSAYVATCVSPNKGVTYVRRATKGAKTQITAGPVDSTNVTVEIKRVGTQITSRASSDGGTTWSIVRTETLSLKDPVKVGLLTTSSSASTANIATFDNVSITTP